jgi:hypothetical protein
MAPTAFPSVGKGASTIMREMHEQRRHQPEGQAIVHRDMLERMTRHAGMCGLTWVLHDGEAPAVFDCHEPSGTVRQIA